LSAAIPSGTFRWLELYEKLSFVFAGLSILLGLISAVTLLMADEVSVLAVLLTLVGTFFTTATILALRDASSLLLGLSQRR